jgi:predicted ester cyclase
MRRSLVGPLSLLLAVATGAAAGQTFELASSPIVPTVSGEATLAAVRAFYDAANAVIETGDASVLAIAIAPDYVDHAGLPGVTPDRDGLGTYLASLHGVAPGTRLTSDDVFAEGNRAMARVRISGTREASFLGVAFGSALTVWSDADVFRVASRRVVERWSGPEATVAFDTLGLGPTGTSLPSYAGLALERIVLAPGDRIEGPASESRLVEVEAGTLAIAVDASSVGSVSQFSAQSDAADNGLKMLPPGAEATAATGDLVSLPVSASYALANAGTGSATLLVTSFFPADDPRRAAPSSDPSILPGPGPWPPNITPEVLAGGSAIDVPPGATAAGIGRVTLTPGAWLPGLTAPGPLLAFVEAGSLDFAMATGTAWIRDGVNGASRNGFASPLLTGDGALLPPGAAFSLRNSADVPAVVLVVALTPSG